MRSVVLALLFLCLASSSFAQDRVARLIEDNLSAPGRTVAIEGFKGALSTRASLEKLTISDERGVWFVMTDAVLDWNASALLKRTLEVAEISAARIDVIRPPAPSPDQLPSAQASGFSIPELPVVVALDEISVPLIVLGPDILGEAVSLQASAAALLKEGAANVSLNANRIDGTDGKAVLSLAYDPVSSEFDIDLDIAEQKGGLLARSLAIPGTPKLRLSAKGSGPLDNFAADISLQTDNQNRLGGSVILEAKDQQSRAFKVDIGGDIRPLLDSASQPFFGAETRVRAEGTAFLQSGLSLDELEVSTAHMALYGKARLSQNWAPEFLDLKGQLRADQGGTSRIPGTDIVVQDADIQLAFDAMQGPDWTFAAAVSALSAQGVEIAQTTLSGTGKIDPLGDIPFDGLMRLSSVGLQFSDPDVMRAFGPEFNLEIQTRVNKSGVATIPEYRVRTRTGDLNGEGQITLSEGQVRIATKTSANIPNLAPFAGLARPVRGGNAQAKVNATLSLPSGRLEAAVSAQTRYLDIAVPKVAFALTPDTQIDATIRRDEAGLYIDGASVTNSQINLRASGAIGTPNPEIKLSARLADISGLVSSLSGPVSGEATLSNLQAVPYFVASVESRSGIRAQAQGQIGLPGGAVQLTASGTAPLALAGPFIGNRSLSGRAIFRVAMSGQPTLNALTGTIDTQSARLSDPALGLVVSPVATQVRLQNGRANMSANGAINDAPFLVNGAIVLTPPYQTQMGMKLNGFRYAFEDVARTRVDADLSLSGSLQNRLGLSGAVELSDSLIRVPDTGLGTVDPVPLIRHLNAPAGVRSTLVRAGFPKVQGASGSGPEVPLNLVITAKDPIFVRGRGLDAEFAGRLRVDGTVTDPVPVGRFDLRRGRLSFLGQRLNLTEGSITAAGRLIPRLRIVAEASADDIAARIILQGPADTPELVLSSVPELPQDEILSRLLFGKSTQSLSPFQVARLISSLSQLSGRGPGLLDTARSEFGFDDLDIRTDQDTGDAELAIGKYISDNVYSEVEIGEQGDTTVNLNLDLSNTTKLRGSVNSGGETGIGIFWERDY